MKKRNTLLVLGSIIVISLFIFKQNDLVMSGEFNESMTKTNDEWKKF